mgnify:FL=1
MDRYKIIGFGGAMFIVIAIIGILLVNNYISSNLSNVDTDLQMEQTIEKLLSFSFKDKVDSEEYVIIDIRTPQEYNSERIKGAINIDFYSDSFEEEINKLDKDKKYLFYCRSGSRSSSALPLFEELGFREVYELQGGIQSWVSAGYDIETCDECI